MSREIKFRLWEKKTNRFLPLDSYHIFYLDGKIHRVCIHTPCMDMPLSAVVIQQYTGLKDKNEVEIYEGDIIQAFGSLMYVVEWCQTYCEYTYKTITHQDGVYRLTVGDVRRQSHVIGNIFENPELLIEKQ